MHITTACWFFMDVQCVHGWWVQWLSCRALDMQSLSHWFNPQRGQLHSNLGHVVHTYVPLSPSSINWYRPKDGDVLRLGRWLQAWRKVMAAYRCGKSPVGWLPVHWDQLRTQHSLTSMGDLYVYRDCGVYVKVVHHYMTADVRPWPQSVDYWDCSINRRQLWVNGFISKLSILH